MGWVARPRVASARAAADMGLRGRLEPEVVAKLPIYVTGHSLGGGMAHMFAVALMLRGDPGALTRNVLEPKLEKEWESGVLSSTAARGNAEP